MTSALVLAASLASCKAVAQNIADAVEDLRRHIIMRENDRILFALQVADCLDIRRVRGPFERGDDALDASINRLQLADRFADKSRVKAVLR